MCLQRPLGRRIKGRWIIWGPLNPSTRLRPLKSLGWMKYLFAFERWDILTSGVNNLVLVGVEEIIYQQLSPVLEGGGRLRVLMIHPKCGVKQLHSHYCSLFPGTVWGNRVAPSSPTRSLRNCEIPLGVRFETVADSSDATNEAQEKNGLREATTLIKINGGVYSSGQKFCSSLSGMMDNVS